MNPHPNLKPGFPLCFLVVGLCDLRPVKARSCQQTPRRPAVRFVFTLADHGKLVSMVWSELCQLSVCLTLQQECIASGGLQSRMLWCSVVLSARVRSCRLNWSHATLRCLVSVVREGSQQQQATASENPMTSLGFGRPQATGSSGLICEEFNIRDGNAGILSSVLVHQVSGGICLAARVTHCKTY